MAAKSYTGKWPRKRWFLGYTEFEIRTAVLVQQVIDVLNENSDVKRRLFSQKPFLGSVDSNQFVLKFNYSMATRIYGSIRQEGGGSILDIAVKENGEILFALCICIVLGAIWLSSFDMGSLLRGVPCHVVVFFAVRLWSYLGFRFDAACIRRRFRRMFD
jgi:hypothetical protein